MVWVYALAGISAVFIFFNVFSRLSRLQTRLAAARNELAARVKQREEVFRNLTEMARPVTVPSGLTAEAMVEWSGRYPDLCANESITPLIASYTEQDKRATHAQETIEVVTQLYAASVALFPSNLVSLFVQCPAAK